MIVFPLSISIVTVATLVHLHCRVLSMEEKLKDSSISYENKLLAEEKKHRDAVVCISHLLVYE